MKRKSLTLIQEVLVNSFSCCLCLSIFIKQELVEDFLFPASKIVLQSRKTGGEFPLVTAVPVCATPPTVIAAFDLLVAQCTNCVPNLKCLAHMLLEMFYNGK